MAFRLAVESALQDEVQTLIEALDSHLEPLSPLEHQYKMTAEEMAAPDTTVFVARDDHGEAIGLGALKLHDDEVGEVKRMFTLPRFRGQGSGRAVLEAIEAHAAQIGLVRLVLETGKEPGYKSAHRLYQSMGFSRCGPVLDYQDTGSSDFFTKELQ